MIEFDNLDLKGNDGEWACTHMECDKCGFEWEAVHPVCEWLQCECGAWNQVPPFKNEEES